MKILHIVPSLIKGGAERLAIDMCLELAQLGHQVKMVVLRPDNDYAHICKDLDLTVVPAYVKPSVLRKWQINTAPLDRFIETFKPDIIHSHLFEAELVSRENTFAGIKYFTHCHDNMPQLRNFSPATLLNKKLLTDLYEKDHLVAKYKECNNKFIAISKDTMQYFEEVLPGSLSTNITLLNNAINFKRFNTVNKPRALDKIRIVNVGSFIPKKNQHFFISIAQELVKRGIDAEIKLLGDGPLLPGIKAAIEVTGLQKMIAAPGNVKFVEEDYALGNVYVHTATYEPFGLVLLEAMAAGLPVISLDGRGNRDLVHNGITGYLFKQQNAAAFVNAILQVTKSSEAYNAMSDNAVAFARQYDIAAYVARLNDLYLNF